MEIISDKGLSKRILILFVFTTLVLILQGIYNIYSLSGVNHSITRVYDSVNQVSVTSSDISLPISELRQLSMSLVMAPNDALRQALKTQIVVLEQKTNENLDAIDIASLATADAGKLFDDIRSAWNQYAEAVDVTVDYSNQGVRIAEFISVTIGEKEAYDKVTQAILEYNQYQLRISAETFQKAQDNAIIAFWAVLITTLVEVIILKVILAYVLNLVRKYVATRKQHAEEVRSKNEAIEKSDQLKQLLDEQILAEQKLNQLRNYLANIIDSMPSILIGVDLELVITQWNHAAETATGTSAEEAKGKSLDDVFPRLSSEKERIIQAIKSHQEQSDLKRPLTQGGSIIYEDITIYPLKTNGIEGAVIRLDDVTEQVRMQEMMVQSEKMLSVGGLAAGMAHEINNPLAGMMQTSEVMVNRLTNLDMPANIKAAEEANVSLTAVNSFMESRGILRMVNDIKLSGRRVADIVDNMLSFARKSDSTFSSCELGKLLDKSLSLAIADYDLKKHHDFKNINIIREYDSELPLVPCEEVKIQQVILNILRNGAQEMQANNTDNASFTLRTYLHLDKDKACIDISDNGPGMEEAVRKRVFEPFFTTKSVGVGTGLGLSVSYFIVTENHGGELDVVSSVGEGTTFTIRLPINQMEFPT